jgi:hypothetical protein
MFWTLFKGQALSYFGHHLMRRLEAEESDVPDNDLIELVLRYVGLENILKRAIRVQSTISVKQFVERCWRYPSRTTF